MKGRQIDEIVPELRESDSYDLSGCLITPGFVAYDGYVLAQKEKLVIQKTADALGVNYTPMLTRLKELDLFDLRPIDEYLESEFYHGGESRT